MADLASRSSSDDKKHLDEKAGGDFDHRKTAVVSQDGEIINASGHADQLQRHYGLLSICGLALNIDNAWVAFGGSLSISVLNGGPPGIIYELIVACIFYGFIGASIAELCSSVPSSGGVYHWASITPGPKYGRVIGFFCGWLNFFGWIFDVASIIAIPANVCVAMYSVYHPDFEPQAYHSFIAFVIITWSCTAFVIFCNRLLPKLQHVGLFFVLAGGLITIIVVAAMPKQHATNAFVWKDFENMTGWSNGICFLTGVLNGAFTIGTPDAITHLAEELPNPSVDMPKAVFAQVGLGFLTTLMFAIAIMYGINDLTAVSTTPLSFPLAEVYAQATGNQGATFGLLFIILISVLICSIGTLMMVGRLYWVLARDNATPFAKTFGKVNERLSCPIPATLLCAVLTTAFGAIQLGSKTAFTDLVGSFIILTTVSYFLAIFPNLLTGRKYMPRGHFYMGKFGIVINSITCLLIVFFIVWFCFPYAFPVDPLSLMNWNSIILVGCVLLTAAWWFIHGVKKYPGPKLAQLYH
ncbi:hypothetical protein B0A48_06278 [Cryoendolithus antarcticus]|uniref:Choline transport protein n=1 Tax=Cryoendolithus antarcticus TaxID=1507870 RepID=A0A1V8TAZ5_9PEZI|nr:hypothetical protein B0A48_06278 [Cryoendolithus antarcticus]